MLSDAGWLDTHFAWMRPEYEAMLRWVGIKPGWRVLDAGSGPGSFLPLMTALVGPTGSIDAIDLAPENITTLKKRRSGRNGWRRSRARSATSRRCHMTTTRLTRLVREHHAISERRPNCAHCSAEAAPCRAAGRAGSDQGIGRHARSNSSRQRLLFLSHFLESSKEMARPGYGPTFKQLLRTADLPRWLREAGLVDLRQKPMFMVRSSPLDAYGRAFLTDLIKRCAAPCFEHCRCQRWSTDVWRQACRTLTRQTISSSTRIISAASVQTVFAGVVPD